MVMYECICVYGRDGSRVIETDWKYAAINGTLFEQLRNFIESIGKFVSDQKRLSLEKVLYEIEWLFVIACAYWVEQRAENNKEENITCHKKHTRQSRNNWLKRIFWELHHSMCAINSLMHILQNFLIFFNDAFDLTSV